MVRSDWSVSRGGEADVLLHVLFAGLCDKQDALRAEIERKRKLKELEFGGKKFARLADLQAAREETDAPDAGPRAASEQATLANAPAEQVRVHVARTRSSCPEGGGGRLCCVSD